MAPHDQSADGPEQSQFVIELSAGQFIQLRCTDTFDGAEDTSSAYSGLLEEEAEEEPTTPPPHSTNQPPLVDGPQAQTHPHVEQVHHNHCSPEQSPVHCPSKGDEAPAEEMPDTSGGHVCSKCCMGYGTASALAQHHTKAHAQDEGGSECDICGKTFGAQKAIRRHMKTHWATKPHACLECGATFADGSNLSKHLKRHTGELRSVEERLFGCEECGKRFKWATSLAKHRRHHTGRSLHRCPQCPKEFAEAKALRLHSRTHSGETPFACSVCGHRFSQEANRNRHLRTHTQERPFVCALCQKAFRQPHHLADHMATHSAGRKARGQRQGKGRGESQLQVHERVQHEQKDLEAMECLRDELLAEMEGREQRQRGQAQTEEAAGNTRFEIV